MALKPPAPPAVRVLSCPGCGAALEVRAPGHSKALACGACGSVVDPQDPDARLIATYERKQPVAPRIPLGARGTLKGQRWEVIGFLVRETTIEGETFRWSEYLLFNPYHGFRWLSEYNDHWTFAKAASGTPKPTTEGQVSYLGATYRHFQTATARVRHVVGEFPWLVRAGDAAVVIDYVNPPFLLSCEKTKDETAWSTGEYVDGARLWQAFSLPGTPPVATGVGAAQPSPFAPHAQNVGLLLASFLAAAVAIHIAFTLVAQQRVVYRNDFTYRQGFETSAVVEPLELTGRRSNVVVDLYAPVLNSWVYFHMTLVDQETGQARVFGREVAFYTGRDGDGPWTEGSTEDRVYVPFVPAGRYALLIEPETPLRQFGYRVTVRRDVPRALYAWAALGLLVGPPLVFAYRRFAFEHRRWQDSDHPYVKSSDDDDGGSDDDD